MATKAEEVTLPTQLIATVSRSRKVSDGNYGSQDAGLFLQVDITGLSVVDTNETIMTAFAEAQSLVDAALQSESQAVATVQKAVPGAVAEKAPAKRASGGSTDLPTYSTTKNPCQQCGGTEFGDARQAKKDGTVSPRYPDFKCLGEFEGKVCGKGVWLPSKKPANK